MDLSLPILNQPHQPHQPPKPLHVLPHTLILTIGPTCSGKTTWCHRVVQNLQTQLVHPGQISYLSTDLIRKQILGDSSLARWDHQMMCVSKLAFEILHTTLNAMMSYPVNKPLIVLDSTALQQSFRDKITQLAQQHQYHIVVVLFHPKRSQLQQNVRSLLNQNPPSSYQHTVNSQHKTMCNIMSSRFPSPIFSDVRRLTDLDAMNRLQIVLDDNNWKLLQDCQLDASNKWYIIGDIHACATSFWKLLKKLPGIQCDDSTFNITIHEGFGIVLVGDVVDKGHELKEILNILTPLVGNPRFKIVCGNHEQKTFVKIVNHLPPSEQTSLPYISHLPQLQNDEQMRNQFLSLYKSTLPFVQCYPNATTTHLRPFIVTHSPCETKYLGKLDTVSKNKQMSYPYRLESQSQSQSEIICLPQLYELLQKQRDKSLPYHVFGHVPFQHVLCLDQYVGVDTGCVDGNRMTAVLLDQYPRFFHVSCESTQKRQTLFVLQNDDTLSSSPSSPSPQPSSSSPSSPSPQPSPQPTDVSKWLKKKIENVIKYQVNFISGTISPAAATSTKHLEDLQQAYNMFQTKNINNIVLQPKYMGSRCQWYWKPNGTSYTISRNGHLISNISNDDIRRIDQQLKERICHHIKSIDYKNIDTIIFDGELLPWSFMGQGLIDRYRTFGIAERIHLEMLNKYRFREAWTSTIKTQEEIINQLPSSLAKLNKVESLKVLESVLHSSTLAQTVYRQYQLVQPMKQWMSITETQKLEDLEVYNHQMNLYGRRYDPVTQPLEFKPFDILKIVKTDGTEQIQPFDNDQVFSMINTDASCVVQLDDPQCCLAGRQFFDQMTNQGMEGVVVKPCQRNYDIPFVKVRNESYLSIIYGPHFRQPAIYQVMCQRKNIKRKLDLSIKEWKQGLQMLKYPLFKIQPQTVDPSYIQLLTDFLNEENSHNREIDVRL